VKDGSIPFNFFETELKRKYALFYTPFPLLTPSTTTGSDTLSFPQLASIEKLISEKQWFAARQASSTLIQQTLEGLHYLQTYDRFLIRGIVSAAYMGWAAYAILHIVRPLDYPSLGSKPAKNSTTLFVTVASWIVLLAFWTLFALQHSPWSFYVYIIFPCYFWWQVLVEICAVIPGWDNWRATSGLFRSGVSIVIKVVMVVLALQGMVVR
jgi:GPI ethanolamine phosphate transferase 1